MLVLPADAIVVVAVDESCCVELTRASEDEDSVHKRVQDIGVPWRRGYFK